MAKTTNPGSASNETTTGSQTSGDKLCAIVERACSSDPGDTEAHEANKGVATKPPAAMERVASSTAMTTATERQIIDSNRSSALNMFEPCGFLAAVCYRR